MSIKLSIEDDKNNKKTLIGKLNKKENIELNFFENNKILKGSKNKIIYNGKRKINENFEYKNHYF
jgi:hypothetical protein